MNPERHIAKKTHQGSSLLLVLWAIMLMSFAVIGLISHLSRGVDESIYAEKEFRARLLLQSARALSEHPDIEWGDPLLHQWVTSTTSYDVTLTTEGTRLCINKLATDSAVREFAIRLFEKWGMDRQQSETLAESIADWIDTDDRPCSHGAEQAYYTALGRPDLPYNRPLDSIDDLTMIRGADELDNVRPDWRDFLTLYGDGKIDIHRASGEMLAVLFDVTESEISRFTSARLGPDNQPDTIDDRRFATLTEVRNALDVPQLNYARVSSLLVLDHPIKRTECYARAGSLERRLTIISGPALSVIREQ